MSITLDRLNRQLASIERDPLAHNVNPQTPKAVLDQADGSPVTLTYTLWVEAARRERSRLLAPETRTRLFFNRLQQPNAEMQKKLLRLERQEIGLMYRANVAKPREYTPQDKATLELQLSTILTRYKRNQDLYPGGNGDLTPQDRVQIHEACVHFPVFAQALIDRNRGERNNDPWTTSFVKFCMRSCGVSGGDARHWVKIFVEFPNEVDLLCASRIEKRIGAAGPNALNIVRQGDLETLCLRIDGRDVRIQGAKDTPITLANRVNPNATPLSTTVERIYKIIEEKRSAYGPVEAFHDGILNWDAIQLGSTQLILDANAQATIDPIRVVQQNEAGQPILDGRNFPRARQGWIYDLPVWRRLSAQEVSARYANQVHWDENVPHNDRFGIAMCANRGEASLNMVDTHGFFELVIPEPDHEGQFRILPCGFQPPTLPANTIQKAKIMLDTQESRFHYPDEGPDRSERGQYKEFFAMTPEQFRAGEAYLSRYITKSREHREIFQLTGTNCAAQAQKTFHKFLQTKFFVPFENLVHEIFPERDVHTEVKQITKYLDEATLERLATQVAERLVEQRDHERTSRLLSLCFKTLSDTLKTDAPLQDLDISEGRALERIQTLYAQNPEADAILRSDISKLIQLTIGSQQFYKLRFFDAEFRENRVLQGFFTFISLWASDRLVRLSATVEWWSEIPRVLLYYLFTCVVLSLANIAAWRGHSYLRNDGTIRTARVMTNPLTGRMIHLPAQAFNRPGLKADWRNQVQEILRHIPVPQAVALANPEPHVSERPVLSVGALQLAVV
ncbi:MAG: hypothetical protein ACHQT8_03555 [Chlamydiales bacterium]